MNRLLLLIFSLMLYVNGWAQCSFNGPNSMNLNINGGGNTICPYENITVDVTQAPGGSTYLWSTGATTSSISVAPATTTTYTVTVTCSAGNTATQSITANVSNVSVGINATVGGTTTNNPSSITINCGQSVNLAGFGVGGNNNDYDWLFPNIPDDQTITVNPTQTTSYFLVGTGNGNCKDTDTIVINVNPLNNAAFSNNRESIYYIRLSVLFWISFCEN